MDHKFRDNDSYMYIGIKADIAIVSHICTFDYDAYLIQSYLAVKLRRELCKL